MNKRAAELPMNTIIIVVLVVIVLIAVGIFFYMQFSKGGAIVGQTSTKSSEGGVQLNQSVNWTQFKQSVSKSYSTGFDVTACNSPDCAGT